MSHFATLVLTERGSAEEVSGLMARYDAERAVAPHETKCPCVGLIAFSEGRAQAGEELAPLYREIQGLRERIGALMGEMAKATGGEIEPMDLWGVSPEGLPGAIRRMAGERPGLEELEGEMIALAEALAAKAEQAARIEQAHVREHPLYDKPSPSCPECGGSGRTETTANPEGYWDSYAIGGRFAGMLDPDYDPSHDTRNYSRCDLCQGTGTRWWLRVPKEEAPAAGLPGPLGESLIDEEGRVPVAVEPGTEGAEERECDGCEGTGVQRNLQNAPHPKGDSLRAGKAAELIEAGRVPAPLRARLPRRHLALARADGLVRDLRRSPRPRGVAGAGGRASARRPRGDRRRRGLPHLTRRP